MNSTVTTEIIEFDFMPLIRAGEYDKFPAVLRYNGMLTKGKAMTFEEFLARN